MSSSGYLKQLGLIFDPWFGGAKLFIWIQSTSRFPESRSVYIQKWQRCIAQSARTGLCMHICLFCELDRFCKVSRFTGARKRDKKVASWIKQSHRLRFVMLYMSFAFVTFPSLVCVTSHQSVVDHSVWPWRSSVKCQSRNLSLQKWSFFKDTHTTG